MINNIQAMFRVHEQLRQYATALQVSIENATIVLRGTVPSVDLKAELVPAVRRAGVLGQVSNCVDVANS
jgi:hypothetical protein